MPATERSQKQFHRLRLHSLHDSLHSSSSWLVALHPLEQAVGLPRVLSRSYPVTSDRSMTATVSAFHRPLQRQTFFVRQDLATCYGKDLRNYYYRLCCGRHDRRKHLMWIHPYRLACAAASGSSLLVAQQAPAGIAGASAEGPVEQKKTVMIYMSVAEDPTVPEARGHWLRALRRHRHRVE